VLGVTPTVEHLDGSFELLRLHELPLHGLVPAHEAAGADSADAQGKRRIKAANPKANSKPQSKGPYIMLDALPESSISTSPSNSRAASTPTSEVEFLGRRWPIVAT